MRRNRISRYVCAVCLVFMVTGALALDPPDSELNPESGDIETVEALSQTANFNIRHIVDPGSGGPTQTTMISSHSDDDLDPRLVHSESGDTWIVWWRDGAEKEIWIRKHDYSTGTWETEKRVSTAGIDSIHPEIAYNGTEPWVAFESINAGGGIDISVSSIVDDPEPVLMLANSSYTGDLDIKLHFESTHLWVTWIDDEGFVGWSAYDAASESWGSAGYESYSNDSAPEARARVRSNVLGL